jgi:hypothetical protein
LNHELHGRAAATVPVLGHPFLPIHGQLACGCRLHSLHVKRQAVAMLRCCARTYEPGALHTRAALLGVRVAVRLAVRVVVTVAEP